MTTSMGHIPAPPGIPNPPGVVPDDLPDLNHHDLSLRKAAEQNDALILASDLNSPSSSSVEKTEKVKKITAEESKLRSVAQADACKEQTEAVDAAKAEAERAAQHHKRKLEASPEYQEEHARLKKQLADLQKFLRRDIWVCDVVQVKMQKLQLLLQSLIVAVPVLSVGILQLCKEMIPEERGVGHAVGGVLMCIHAVVVLVSHSLHLDRKLGDLEKVQKMSSTILDAVNFGETHKNEDLKILFTEVRKKMDNMRNMSDFHPAEWAYKMYDAAVKSGKIATHPSDS